MFKKIGIICLFLIFVCCLSAVCAADLNQTNDVNVGVSCVNGTTDDINVDEVDESQDLDSVSGDLDKVDESEISAIECSSATSHASAGHKIISNILILNHTNGTHFPLPYFPGDHKPVSSVLILNHWDYTPLDYDDLKNPDQFCSSNVFTCGSILEIDENAHPSQLKLKLKDSNIELLIVYNHNVSKLKVGDEITVFGYGAGAWCGLPVMNINFFYPGFHENNHHVIW